jgi:hypothetical protein
MSSRHRWLGCSATRTELLLGRLWGCGVTNPRAVRIRQGGAAAAAWRSGQLARRRTLTYLTLVVVVE